MKLLYYNADIYITVTPCIGMQQYYSDIWIKMHVKKPGIQCS